MAKIKYREKTSKFDKAVHEFKCNYILSMAKLTRRGRIHIADLSNKTGLSRNTIYKLLQAAYYKENSDEKTN